MNIQELQKQVDAMPLDTWLKGIRKSFEYAKFIGKPTVTHSLMKEFVHGMFVRGLEYHWDDCPHDCLSGKITSEQGNTIEELVKYLYCDEMFTLTLERMDIGYDKPLLCEQMEMTVAMKKPEIKLCTCDIRDLCTQGCKCGGK